MTTPFSKLSRASQRVAIAKDVLAQIAAKVYIAKSMSYLQFPDIDWDGNDGSEQLQKAINNKTIKCEVCGIGSLFASMIKFKNHLTIDEAENKLDGMLLVEKMKRIFSKNQLSLIELAFEKKVCGISFKSYSNMETTEEQERAIKFGRKYKTEEDRLKGIMHNLIKNNGTFVV